MAESIAFTTSLPLAAVPARHPTSVSSSRVKSTPLWTRTPARAAVAAAAPPPPAPAWHKRLRPGAVVEYYARGAARMSTVVESLASSVLVSDETGATCKIARGDIISVWSTTLTQEGLAAASAEADILLRRADLSDVVRSLHSQRARGKRANFNASAAGKELFPDATHAAATIAASRALSGAQERFTRHQPGEGWRARPDAVVKTLEAESFVKTVKNRLEGGPEVSAANPYMQRLEVCAASGTAPDKSLKRVLAAAGYEETAKGAGELLEDVGHWERAPKGVVSTFTPDALNAARVARDEARARRNQWALGEIPDETRRDLRDEVFAYCVDDRNTNFLDDAVSIRNEEGTDNLHVYVHIADVAAHITAGSVLDELARERAQSMYLPLRPLHMLPPPAMDGCSFSETHPTEAITVALVYNTRERSVTSTEVFTSVVPPVLRVSFDDYDRLLESQRRVLPGILNEDHCRALRSLAHVAPNLIGKSVRKRAPRFGGVSGVRLVRDGERSTKRAQVATFRETGAFKVIGDILSVAGGAFRAEARRLGAALPEAPGAKRYTRRCGTAPMRKYLDLAVQRQLGLALRGEKPASSSEMGRLRSWLHQRREAASTTVAARRSAAIIEAFADRCDEQKKLSNRVCAIVEARVGLVSVSRRGVLRVSVSPEPGIDCIADLEEDVRDIIVDWVETGGYAPEDDNNEQKLETKVALKKIALRKIFPVGASVQLQVDAVDRTTRTVRGTVLGAAAPDALLEL